MSEDQGLQSLVTIEGRVAQILNERELAVNIGSEAGVKQGMKFAVMAAQPLQVCDPESGKVLDVIDREKVRVEAHEVRRQITICRTYRTVGGEGSAFSAAGVIARVLGAETRVETLRARDASLPPPLAPEESYVKIGDRVRQVTDA